MFSVQNRFAPSQIGATFPDQAKDLSKFQIFCLLYYIRQNIPFTYKILYDRTLTRLFFFIKDNEVAHSALRSSRPLNP